MGNFIMEEGSACRVRFAPDELSRRKKLKIQIFGDLHLYAYETFDMTQMELGITGTVFVGRYVTFYGDLRYKTKFYKMSEKGEKVSDYYIVDVNSTYPYRCAAIQESPYSNDDILVLEDQTITYVCPPGKSTRLQSDRRIYDLTFELPTCKIEKGGFLSIFPTGMTYQTSSIVLKIKGTLNMSNNSSIVVHTGTNFAERASVKVIVKSGLELPRSPGKAWIAMSIHKDLAGSSNICLKSLSKPRINIEVRNSTVVAISQESW